MHRDLAEKADCVGGLDPSDNQVFPMKVANNKKDKKADYNSIKKEKYKGLPFDPAILIIFTYLVIALLSIYYVSGVNFCKEPERVIPLNHPPDGARYVALISGAIMIVFALLAHFLYVRKQEGWKLIAANIFVIIFFFGTLELAITRYANFHPSINQLDSRLIWRQKPNSSDFVYSTNSKSLRYEEFPEKKDDKEYRFMLIGDSSAFGLGVPVELRFSNLLEKELQKFYPEKKIRIINAAIPGYSVFQGRKLYDMEHYKYSPDCIILSYNNDTTIKVMRDEDRLPPRSLQPLLSILYRSNLFLLLRKRILLHWMEREKSIFIKAAQNPKLNCWRVPKDDIRKHYFHLIQDVKSRGGSAIIIAMPLSGNAMLEDDNSMEYKAIIRKITQSTDSIFLDADAEFRSDPDNESCFIPGDIVHPNEKGHGRIAKILFNVIVRENIVK